MVYRSYKNKASYNGMVMITIVCCSGKEKNSYLPYTDYQEKKLHVRIKIRNPCFQIRKKDYVI